MLMRGELMRHFKSISSEKDPDTQRAHRKKHTDFFEKITSRYEELGYVNCVHAVYEYAYFLILLGELGI